MIRKKIFVIIAAIVSLTTATARTAAVEEKDMAGYLFVYFTGNDISQEAICFALSNDGLSWHKLNAGRPVIDSKVISSTGGVRDPHILRGEDGHTFYMVATDMVSANGWDSNRAMVLLKSEDLINWSHSIVNIQQTYEGQDDLKRVWAPQTIYDHKAGKYMIYWSMKHGDGPDIIYYAYANDSFTGLTGEPRPLFIPANRKSCIDGDIVYKDGKYHLFYKTEGHGNGIKVAVTNELTSGCWTESPDYKQQTDQAVEGAGTFKLSGADKYILMYDLYTSGRYQFTETTDLEHFRAIDSKVTMDFHPRHGTVMAVTRDEMKRLTDKWGLPEGVTIPRNPVLTGFHADPEILYSEQTGRYYIYSTTDGVPGWGGVHFTVFESSDTRNWTEAGTVLDLKAGDAVWADGNAWAPCIIEKKIKGRYRYFFYYSGNSKDGKGKQIGVATGDTPTGPFKDALGKPLITDAMTPNGKRGWWNDIDPTVLVDDQGTPWLSWGNGTCFIAKLKPDMMSLDGPIEVLDLPHYVEGPWLHKRGDLYYLTYASMGKGREMIHYATAKEIGGTWTYQGALTGMAENSFTIHPSIVEFNGNWYLFYHNATLTLEGKGGATGRRSVCADYLYYYPDGKMAFVEQTKSGVSVPPKPLGEALKVVNPYAGEKPSEVKRLPVDSGVK